MSIINDVLKGLDDRNNTGDYVTPVGVMNVTRDMVFRWRWRNFIILAVSLVLVWAGIVMVNQTIPVNVPLIEPTGQPVISEQSTSEQILPKKEPVVLSDLFVSEGQKPFEYTKELAEPVVTASLTQESVTDVALNEKNERKIAAPSPEALPIAVTENALALSQNNYSNLESVDIDAASSVISLTLSKPVTHLMYLKNNHWVVSLNKTGTSLSQERLREFRLQHGILFDHQPDALYIRFPQKKDTVPNITIAEVNQKTQFNVVFGVLNSEDAQHVAKAPLVEKEKKVIVETEPVLKVQAQPIPKAAATPKVTVTNNTLSVPVAETMPPEVAKLVSPQSAETATRVSIKQPLSDSKKAEGLYFEGLELASLGHWRSAASRLEAAAILVPSNLEVRETLAGIYLNAGDYQQAKQHTDAGLQIAPSSIALKQYHARILIQKNQLNQAILFLEQQPPTVASHPDYHAFLARLYHKIGKSEKAVETYQTALMIQPFNGTWLMGMAIALESVERTDEAYRTYQQALKSSNLAPESKLFVERRVKELKRLAASANLK